MSQARSIYRGTCHCGNIEVNLESNQTIGQFETRRCACSFCRTRGGLYTSDPEDLITYRVAKEDWLQRYRFGHGTADFIICRNCGAFMGAFMADDTKVDRSKTECPGYSVINLVNLQTPQPFPQPQGPAYNYEEESPAERRARRRARWSPARLIVMRQQDNGAPTLSPSLS